MCTLNGYAQRMALGTCISLQRRWMVAPKGQYHRSSFHWFVPGAVRFQSCIPHLLSNSRMIELCEPNESTTGGTIEAIVRRGLDVLTIEWSLFWYRTLWEVHHVVDTVSIAHSVPRKPPIRRGYEWRETVERKSRGAERSIWRWTNFQEHRDD